MVLEASQTRTILTTTIMDSRLNDFLIGVIVGGIITVLLISFLS